MALVAEGAIVVDSLFIVAPLVGVMFLFLVLLYILDPSSSCWLPGVL